MRRHDGAYGRAMGNDHTRGTADRAAPPAPTILLTGSFMTGHVAAWAAEAFGARRDTASRRAARAETPDRKRVSARMRLTGRLSP